MSDELGRWLDQQYLEWQAKQGGRKPVLEFAQFLGVGHDALYKWMNRKRMPDLESVQKIAEKLGSTIYDLAGFPRPDPNLSRISRAWDDLSEEEQSWFAADIEQKAEKNKLQAKDKHKHEPSSKATAVAQVAKSSK